VLDDSKNRQTTLTVELQNSFWKFKEEVLYVIAQNHKVVKIGGTRNGMAII
jgi:hypothetical protein